MTRHAANAAQLGLQLEPEKPPRKRRACVLLSFHNKGGAPTVEVAKLQDERNLSQEARVLAFLRAHPGQRFTPPEVAAGVGIKRENSAARALSNLTQAELAEKHQEAKRMGSWGTEVCTWSAR